MAKGHHIENYKITISQERFNRSRANIAWWQYCPNKLYHSSPYTTHTILHNKTAKIISTKLTLVSHIKILSTNSKHGS